MSFGEMPAPSSIAVTAAIVFVVVSAASLAVLARVVTPLLICA